MALNFNIAIDGHSSCGKSTIAKSIAAEFNMKYIDTGAMYRAVTLFCMQNQIISEHKVDKIKLANYLESIEVDFEYNPTTLLSFTYLNGKNVESTIRDIDVSNNVSIIAQLDDVRKKLIYIQRKIGEKGNVVMDGRDIGSKVFPHAKIKFFVTAGISVRALRRYNQMKKNGSNILFKTIHENLKIRDMHDTNRKNNPLVISKDAIILDNSNMSLLQQNHFVFNRNI